MSGACLGSFFLTGHEPLGRLANCYFVEGNLTISNRSSLAGLERLQKVLDRRTHITRALRGSAGQDGGDCLLF